MSKDNQRSQGSYNTGGQDHGYGSQNQNRNERYAEYRGGAGGGSQPQFTNTNQPSHYTHDYQRGGEGGYTQQQYNYDYDLPSQTGGGFYQTNVPYNTGYGGYDGAYGNESDQATEQQQTDHHLMNVGDQRASRVIPSPEVSSMQFSDDEKEEYKQGEKSIVLLGSKFDKVESNMKGILKYMNDCFELVKEEIQRTREEVDGRLVNMEMEIDAMRNHVVTRDEFSSTHQIAEGTQRKMNDLASRVQQINNRVNTLSFNQNSRIARSLKFRYECIVKAMIETEFGISVDFRPLEIREDSEHFREPKQCSENLTKQFKTMRDFMNQVNSHRSPLDNRKDKFLRIPGDKIAFPSVSIDNEGRIVIFRMTTSPLACLFDKNYLNLRHMYTFVKNLFYNMSVLEYQVSSIKRPRNIVLVVFVYESLQYSSSSLADFVRYYPLEFKNLNELFNNNQMVALSMKDLDTKRLSLSSVIEKTKKKNPNEGGGKE